MEKNLEDIIVVAVQDYDGVWIRMKTGNVFKIADMDAVHNPTMQQYRVLLGTGNECEWINKYRFMELKYSELTKLAKVIYGINENTFNKT